MWHESNKRLDATALLSVLNRVFPGSVLWHSFVCMYWQRDRKGRASEATADLLYEVQRTVMTSLN